MDVKQYIASGILELYVAGQLSEKENSEVHDLVIQHPEIASEIIAIETAVLALCKTAAPNYTNRFKNIQKRISAQTETKVIPLNKNDSNWTSYIGWAASIVVSVGLYWMYNQNNELKSQIKIAEKEQIQLEHQIANSNSSLERSQTLLNTIRDKNITGTPLRGQKVSPDSYAKAYWNKKEQKVFIDAKGLPEPLNGMVYQVWSLKLNPLTPTSMGLLENFNLDENKVFVLHNPNESEAFGITLEPAGGSDSPSLNQLYTLGVVTSP
jgi:anti-sigma-K factor RskA